MTIHYHKAMVITSRAPLYRSHDVWGTGGWLPVSEREVLDWMTLIASLGWECVLMHPDELNRETGQLAAVRWVILADDLSDLQQMKHNELLEILANFPLLVIGHVSGAFKKYIPDIQGTHTLHTIKGRKLTYRDSTGVKSWTTRNEIECNVLSSQRHAAPVLTLEHAVIGTRFHSGRARFICLGFQSSEARDAEGVFTEILKEILISESREPVAWYELSNTLLLRMDDPGSAQRVYDRNLNAQTLDHEGWSAIGEILREHGARLSVGYVPAWVDDGEPSYGRLFVKGAQVARVPGKAHPSRHVRYERKEKGQALEVFDQEQEFLALNKLIAQGIASAELHGYTHVFPDKKAWLEAGDRYTNVSWFREFGRSATQYAAQLPAAEHPLEKGMKLFTEQFHRSPSTLIFPGEEFTVNAVKRAWQTGIRMIGSYYLAMPICDQLCWNHYICSPYLDRAHPSFFDHALPVVGYFHDFDITQKGIGWFSAHLDAWVAAGARHFIDYAGLASLFDSKLSLQETPMGLSLLRSGSHAEQQAFMARVGIYVPRSGWRRELRIPGGRNTLNLEQSETEIIHSEISNQWHGS